MTSNPAVHTKAWALKTKGKYNTSILVPWWAREPIPHRPEDPLSELSFAERCMLGDAICRLGAATIEQISLESLSLSDLGGKLISAKEVVAEFDGVTGAGFWQRIQDEVL